MNLHGIVSGVIGKINPFVTATIRVSTGYTTNADGSRTPTYTTTTAQVQLQALAYDDIVQADSMQIQGVRRKMYVQGDVEGLVRADNRGGDLVTLPDGTVWKVAMVDEHWPDWTACIITLQDGS